MASSIRTVVAQSAGRTGRTGGRVLRLVLPAVLAPLLALGACNLPPPEGGVAPPPPTVTVQQGELLYQIALRYGVRTEDIVALNGLTPPYALQPGQVLRMPGGSPNFVAAAPPAPIYTGPPVAGYPTTGPTVAGTGVVQSAPLEAPIATAPPLPAANPSTPIGGTPSTVATQPTVAVPGTLAPLPAEAPSTRPAAPGTLAPLPETSTAPLPAPTPSQPAVASIPPTAPVAGQFRWPVDGAIVSRFGEARGAGTNDGLDIEPSGGAVVVAAADGTVQFAGNAGQEVSGLQRYGNVIVLNHGNKLTTIYTNLSRVMVRKYDRVTAGQAIGEAGAGPASDRPMVHFEIRQDLKPVDPMAYLPAR